MKLDPQQHEAVDLIKTARIGIVTGGPGTGKTTCLRAALDALPKPASTGWDDDGYIDFDDERSRPPDPQVALCAPTGKAARRMREATSWPASTVHRLLGYTGESFRRGPRDPLDCRLVIVDEASMLDTELTAALFQALSPKCRLILVGDADQLPSVGPGQVFADLIAGGKVPTVQLQTLHRAAQDSWVCRNAPRLIQGEMVELDPFDDFEYFDTDGPSDALAKVVKGRANWTGPDVQVLIPQRKGVLGTPVVNNQLQELLTTKTGQSMPIGGGKDFRAWVGDRVINTRNNYQTGIMNGELGEVVLVGRDTIGVVFEGHNAIVTMSRSEAFDLELAYALTIHKSQGSEWPWVIVVCHSNHRFMLSRQLIYTALTRAKKGVILIGDHAGLVRACRNNSPARRQTRLQQRLGGQS